MPRIIREQSINETRRLTCFICFLFKSLPDFIIIKDAKNVFWDAYKIESGAKLITFATPTLVVKFSGFMVKVIFIMMQIIINGTIIYEIFEIALKEVFIRI